MCKPARLREQRVLESTENHTGCIYLKKKKKQSIPSQNVQKNHLASDQFTNSGQEKKKIKGLQIPTILKGNQGEKLLEILKDKKWMYD